MRRLFFAIIAIAVVAVQLPAFAWTHTADGDLHHLVALVGDSNIVYGASHISMGLTPSGVGDVPIIAAAEGASIRWNGCQSESTGRPCIDRTATNYWAVRLPALAGRINPDVWVVELGINDAGALGTATTRGYASYGLKIDYLMRLLPAGARVLWTTLPCEIEPAAYLTGCRAVNAALFAAPARWPNLAIVNWAAVANTHPEYIVAPGNVHYSQAGYDAYTALVVAAMN